MKDAGTTGAGTGSRNAFTLIELLVVMMLIAILVGIMMPAIQGVKDKARERRAEAEALALATAIRNFHHEYGYWPGPGGAGGAWDTNNQLVIANLLPEGNSRSLAFWDTPGCASNPFTYAPFRIEINATDNRVTVR